MCQRLESHRRLLVHFLTSAYRKKPVIVSLLIGMLLCLPVVTLLYGNSIGLIHHMAYVGTVTASSSRAAAGSTQQQVLLLTYGRSGSSFTSALISHHPDVFFTFEPLYVIVKELHAEKESYFINEKEIDSNAIVNAFLTCDFKMEDIYALDNTQHRNSDSTREFYLCLRAKIDGVSHLSCFLNFLKSCQGHKVTFVKSIRFRAKWAEWFLETFPNFKLLMLVRDPRATLYSQSKLFKTFDWKTEIANISSTHCKLLQDDLKDAERLSLLYPGRVKGIRYEDGAMDPFNYTQRIYEFLGMDYNDTIIDYIRNITNSTADERLTRRAYSIEKNNSTKAMNRWRYGAGYKGARTVDATCGHVYKKLGYKFVKSQSDLESDRSLVDVPDTGGIFE
ncbi:unnamed protein product [Lymnaea stagnalis]|uniref:Uncharacterized protein n=1 Tax=Lymnaea stagnalis TaxID=6523 RepID=A0AAV2I7U9_LYMST